MTILIVEDNALIAMTLEATLTGAGYTVSGPVPSAQRALDIAAATPPRVALLNIRLRDGSSGVDLARMLKERWGTAVIFLTGEMIEGLEEGGVAIGALSKPCTEHALLSAIDFATRSQNGERPGETTIAPKGLKIF